METIFTSKDAIVSVNFVHNDWSSDTLAIVTDSEVVVCQLLLDELRCEVLKRYLLTSKPLKFAWSPDTSTESVPQVIKFAVCDFDKSLSITIDTNEQSSPIGEMILGDNHFLNDVAFNPHVTTELAVTGDDCQCRFLDLQGARTRPPLALTAPGKSVAWHRENGALLLVAEEAGAIRLYNVEAGRVLQILDLSHISGLLDLDWMPEGSGGWIAALLPGQVVLADMASPSTSRIAFPTPGDSPITVPHCCRWSPFNRSLLAVSASSTPTAVLHQKMASFMNAGAQSSGSRSVSWHMHRSLLVMAKQYNVHLWIVDVL